MLEEELSNFSEERRKIFYLKTDIGIPDNVLRSLPDVKKTIRCINEESIGAICKQVFNEIPLCSIPLYDSGTFHLLYRIMLPRGLSCVLRINILGPIRRGFHFYIDEWVMETLKQHDLPSLQIYFIDLSRKLCPFDYEIMGEAQGKPLNVAEKGQDSDNRLISEVGKTVAKLHTIETEFFGPLDVKHAMEKTKGKGLFNSWRDYIFLNLDKHIKICRDIGAITSYESRRTETIFERVHPLVEDFTPSLLHGDLGNPNIFHNGKHVTAIVDWEDCLSGDAVFDIAFWGTFSANDTYEKRKLFIKGYTSIRQLPEDFEVRYWLYYLRTALSKTVHRYRFKYPDPPNTLLSQRIQKGLKEVEVLI